MRTAVAALLAVLSVSGVARAGDATGAFAPYEDALGVLAALRRKLEAWGKIIERYTGTPYELAALVEEERLERMAARQVVEHRRVLENGNEAAERSLRFLIQKHADSKNLPAHILELADF